MIKYLDNGTKLLAFEPKDVFAIRVLSLYKTYGIHSSFVNFWIQEENETCTAIISALDNDFTLSFTPGANLEELESFFSIMAPGSLQCDFTFQMDEPIETGSIFQKNGVSDFESSFELEILATCPLDQIFKLNHLEKQGYDYSKWSVDFSERVKKGTVKAFSLLDKETVACTASYTSIWENDIVIGYIATEPKFRGKGYASKLLQFMTKDTQNNYYILCREALKSFYEKIGFTEIGKWSIY